jgi:hypothetical protein
MTSPDTLLGQLRWRRLYVSWFQAVLGSHINSQQVAQMVRAVSVLMYVVRNLFNMRDQLLNLQHSLLACFLSSS